MMADETDDSETNRDPGADEEFSPTPFDHPLFFPAIMFAGLIWFGYDGWINPEYQPGGEKHDSQGFSRWGAGALVLLVTYYGYRGLQELRERDLPDGGR